MENTLSYGGKPLPDSFEEAIQELEAIVKSLEDGRIPLEESLKLYERGSQLKDYCDQKLKSARMKIEEICKDKEGTVRVRPSPLSSDYNG